MKVVLGVPHKGVTTEVYTKNTAAKKFANHLYTCTVAAATVDFCNIVRYQQVRETVPNSELSVAAAKRFVTVRYQQQLQ